jgi:hypothetical protein
MAGNGRKKGSEALLTALAAGKSVKDAALAAGIGERTARRRLAEPDFARRVAEARAGMLSQALGRLADGMSEAADTLRYLLNARGETVRLSAARSILELGPRLRDAVELELRIAALEERFKEKQQ